ncbi:MAG: MCE family protein [Gordonia sp. (in: high G+C Gram-positive bacteria)]|uniref:MlaD family protein n=1 Tax=Gordonia sp. (in: high G+C Gram-positive bacteria) TaxID=84139 RepID=UPI0039E55C26
MVRIDTGGRDPSVQQYLIRGIIFFLVMLLVFFLLLLRYEGKFDKITHVSAQMNDVGDGLISGADVRYNGLIVGSVKSVKTVTDTSSSSNNNAPMKDVELELDPKQAKGIPANTTARTVPSNLFGVNSVELITPSEPSGSLGNNAKVQADDSAETIRLQDAQNDLRNLLQAVPPEDLGMVLGTVADALRGGGATFNTFVGTLDTYWKTVNAQFPAGAPSGFDNFHDAVTGLSKSAPELLDALGKSVVPAMTIAEKQRNLTALLSGGQGLIDQTQTLFAMNGDGGKRIVEDLNTTLGATMLDPDAMPQAAHELYVLAGKVLGVFTGENGHVQLNLGISFSAFEKYERQNCPVYNGGKYGQLRGPGCVGPGTGTGPTSSGPLSIYGSDGIARRTVSSQVTTDQDAKTLSDALGHDPTAADQLMLGPLVSGVQPAPSAKKPATTDKKNDKQTGGQR